MEGMVRISFEAGPLVIATERATLENGIIRMDSATWRLRASSDYAFPRALALLFHLFPVMDRERKVLTGHMVYTLFRTHS